MHRALGVEEKETSGENKTSEEERRGDDIR